MAVRHSVDAQTLGTRLAREFDGNSDVLELWVESDRDQAVFWLITKPLDMPAQRDLYGAVRPLYDAFPDARLILHILNPQTFVDGACLEAMIPSGASKVQLDIRE